MRKKWNKVCFIHCNYDYIRLHKKALTKLLLFIYQVTISNRTLEFVIYNRGLKTGRPNAGEGQRRVSAPIN